MRAAKAGCRWMSQWKWGMCCPPSTTPGTRRGGRQSWNASQSPDRGLGVPPELHLPELWQENSGGTPKPRQTSLFLLVLLQKPFEHAHVPFFVDRKHTSELQSPCNL